MILKNKVSLRPYNTFGIDAQADWLVEYNSVSELERIYATSLGADRPSLHIGGGSNILFTAPFRGVILHSLINTIEVANESDDEILLKVGSGVVWDALVAHCVAHNWYGIENMSHIPGQVGACAVQNIGAYGMEVKDVIKEVYVFEPSTLSHHTLSAAECGYAYRQSNFKTVWRGKYIVTHVLFRLSKRKEFNLNYSSLSDLLSEECTLQAVRERIISIRSEKLPDPTAFGNAGSYFMNPIISASQAEKLKASFPELPLYDLDKEHKKASAAWMIEQCGWKESAHPTVGVSSTQSLVIINKGGATAADIIAFAKEVIRSVELKFGVSLTPEVQYI